ncbi:hypothetical protein [Streptomyces sp. NPDC059009]|uniref:hypothetical protein n=1 Tax=Streptomyces sp. NPDC059009 TaxID=3346694 RepID=UPI0036C7E0C2
MDPNATLMRLRRAVDRIEVVAASPEEDWSGELIDVLEHFDALDQWLRRGGFLPSDWNARADTNR